MTYWMVTKNTKKVLNSDSGIWHLSSVGDEFYLPGEAALHTTTEIWTLRLFLGRNNRGASFSSLKGDKWKRRVPVPVISKVCSCQRRVLSKDRRRQKFKGCSQTLCVSWWKLYHPTKTQDNFNAYDKSFFL